MKFKRKGKKFLWVLAIVGMLVASVGVVAGVMGREKADEGFEFANVTFERGGLDAKGKYSEGKESIYTKEAFECGEGVKIKVDFDSNVSYTVYFYDENDNFVIASETFEKTSTVLSPENAVYARLVVTPIWESDVEENDQVIRFWQTNKYAKQLTVMVAQVSDAE